MNTSSEVVTPAEVTPEFRKMALAEIASSLDIPVELLGSDSKVLIDTDWVIRYAWRISQRVVDKMNAELDKRHADPNTIWIVATDESGDLKASHIRSSFTIHDDMHVMTSALELSQAAGRGVVFEPHALGNIVIHPKPQQQSGD